ncbi:MAG: EAL domain-containing protein [Burkholderiales bacterium]|nr:EAL domain-containing protein [Burkholderiales bacterium]
MTVALSALSPPLLPPLLALAVAPLGAFVAFDLGRRARTRDGHARNPWLMAAALALGTGVWSAQVLALSAMLAPFDAGFDPGLAIVAALVGLALAAGAMRSWLVAEPTWPGVVTGAALLATGVVAMQATLLASLGLAPRIRWHPGWLGLAWVVALAGFVVTASLLLAPAGRGRFAAPWQLARAAAAAAAVVLVAQTLSTAAARLPLLGVAGGDALVPATSMAAAVAAGGLELLLLMLLGSALERRMHRALEQRTAPAPASFRDPVTGLLTRGPFEGTMAQVLKQAETAGTPAVLLLVGLDSFKHVNDAFGHAAGDAVLEQVARRVRELAPPHRVARLGSDEFLVLIDGAAALEQARTLASRVLDAIARPCHIDHREISVTASVGLAVYPQHGAAPALITHAGVAVRAAKAAGGATYSLFDPRMVADSREQAELLRDLRLAVTQRQLELYYQPKVHAPSGQITGAEALLRWNHPKRGMISPGVFIPLAERCGLIQALGDWVIDEACRQVRVWRDGGLRMRVAINLSAHQLRHRELPERVAAALRRHQINPDLLTCEITESVAMEDTAATEKALADLAAVGVHISIDDFGTGYSSLAYLRKLPAHELKIDRGFVLDLECSAEARKIAGAVVQLALSLNLKIVAEGVENDEQYRILREFGCDQLQGYLFAKPMSAKALALWAMDDVGPRSIAFRESLFKATSALVEA